MLCIPRLSEIVSCHLPHLNWITKKLKRRITCSKAFCLTNRVSPKCSSTGKKDWLPAEQLSNVIYLYNCACGHIYVGRTIQRLENKAACSCDLVAGARCPEDKGSTNSKTETAESVDAGPSRIEGQERGAGAKSKKSKKAKTKRNKKKKKKKKKKVGTGVGTSTRASYIIGYFDRELDVWRRPRPVSVTPAIANSKRLRRRHQS